MGCGSVFVVWVGLWVELINFAKEGHKILSIAWLGWGFGFGVVGVDEIN